jgi:hypothetical protein
MHHLFPISKTSVDDTIDESGALKKRLGCGKNEGKQRFGFITPTKGDNQKYGPIRWLVIYPDFNSID